MFLRLTRMGRRLTAEQARVAKTPHERADLEERRNILRRRLTNWMEARNLYIPPLSEDPNVSRNYSAISPPEAAPLQLPSMLPATLRKSCSFKLADIEARFRHAQAEDALSELRRLLRMTMGLQDYKSTQIGPSQRANTRARSLINRFRDKISRCAERYRSARNALLSLDQDGDWQFHLQQLSAEDIRPPTRNEDESEGTRVLSWIWRVARRSGLEGVTSTEQLGPMSDDEVDECKRAKPLTCYVAKLDIGLRCEWVKSKARADRWKEEVQLVTEEMRRVLVFLEWKAGWWMKQGDVVLDVSPDMVDGIRAYAAKQAHLHRSLADSFRKLWHGGKTPQARSNDSDGSSSDTEADDM
jgi:hypothetical protein